MKKELSQEVFSRLYKDFLEKDDRTPYIREILDENPGNLIWIIGSHVYGNLAREIYSKWKALGADIDLLIREAKGFKIPGDWKMDLTGYGTPCIEKDHVKIDLNFLINSIGGGFILNPTPSDFLRGTPLNIESILYDPLSGMIEGEEGIAALNERIVRVNNYQAAENQARIEEISMKTLLKQKATELGFRYEYPSRGKEKNLGTRLKKIK